MNHTSPIVCPECSTALSVDQSACHSCGQGLRRYHGILSFDSKVEPSDSRIERHKIKQLAELTEKESIRTATRTVLSDHPAAVQLLNEIYQNRNDAWRILVSELLEGRCLDLYAGFGRRSLALAEVVDSVYAVDPDLDMLRILANREDFDSGSSVFPIHGNEKSVQFRERSFDTVVADLTGCHPRSVTERIKSISSLVADPGSLLVVVNGITRQSGLSSHINLDNLSRGGPTGYSPFLVRRCQRYLKQLGYGYTQIYPLFPTPEQLNLVYELGNRNGSREAVSRVASTADSYSLIGRLLPIINQFGLLKPLYPTYLITCSQEPRDHRFELPVASAGRSRSVVIEYSADELTTVWKYPNRRRHSLFNEREQEILRWLEDHERHVRETLPDGELVETQFGTVRKEDPVEGQRLSSKPTASLQDTKQIIRTGLDWLIEFQQPANRNRVTLTPDEFATRYQFEQYGIDSSEVSSPVTFFETPIHGDYKPDNIYIKENEVTKVIDWELGSKCENPIVDVAFFILKAVGKNQQTPDILQEIFNMNSDKSVLAKRYINYYCERTDIDYQSFLLLIPTMFLYRVMVASSFDATSTYTTKLDERIDRAQLMWNTIVNQLD